MKPLVVYNSKFLNWINRWPSAITLYPFILFKGKSVSNTLFRHELQHYYDVQKDGWFGFYLRYIKYLIRYGYKNNPYEIHARKMATTPLTKEEVLWRAESWIAIAFDISLVLIIAGVIISLGILIL